MLPRTPQHLLTEDPVTFQYFYDQVPDWNPVLGYGNGNIYLQVLNNYLVDDEILVDNETAVKLGCLELRRFFKDMPQIALKKRDNFVMLE